MAVTTSGRRRNTNTRMITSIARITSKLSPARLPRAAVGLGNTSRRGSSALLLRAIFESHLIVGFLMTCRPLHIKKGDRRLQSIPLNFRTGAPQAKSLGGSTENDDRLS